MRGAARKRVDELSGGQRQRVAIARSMVLEPTLLLLDEPLGALDLKLREHMKIELKQLQASFGTTFVYITHDQSEALVLSDHVARDESRPLRAARHAAGALLLSRPRPSWPASSAPTIASPARVTRRSTASWPRSRPRKAGWCARARRARCSVGDTVAAFIRPGGRATSSAPPTELPADQLALRRRGAEPAVRRRQLRRAAAARSAARFEFRVALPQTGRFADLKVGERVCFGFDPQRAICFAGGSEARRMPELPASAAGSGAWCWLCCWRRRCCGCSLLIVLPHVELALLSLRERVAPREYSPSLAQYKTFFTEPLYWQVFVRTALLSALATALTLLVAFPIAWIITKLARGRVERAAVRRVPDPILGQRDRAHARLDDPAARVRRAAGAAGQAAASPRCRSSCSITTPPSWWAWSIPRCCSWWCRWSSSLESLDNSLIEAAYDLGASGWAILRHIVIPHAAPGITAGCIVVFMLTLGNYLTPTLLGGKNSQWFTELIYTQFIMRFNWEQGAAFGFLLLGLSTAMVALGLRPSGQRFVDVMRRT